MAFGLVVTTYISIVISNYIKQNLQQRSHIKVLNRLKESCIIFNFLEISKSVTFKSKQLLGFPKEHDRNLEDTNYLLGINKKNK